MLNLTYLSWRQATPTEIDCSYLHLYAQWACPRSLSAAAIIAKNCFNGRSNVPIRVFAVRRIASANAGRIYHRQKLKSRFPSTPRLFARANNGLRSRTPESSIAKLTRMPPSRTANSSGNTTASAVCNRLKETTAFFRRGVAMGQAKENNLVPTSCFFESISDTSEPAVGSEEKNILDLGSFVRIRESCRCLCRIRSARCIACIVLKTRRP